ncbi:4719_t:CDS:2 [Gigaspora margarita]|uniref:4719_t:CDS:1 n=1 Tax=Gigaspora margarita TaxID=4874 RepID=A0ABN7UR27_GIGMA|nr:4719_t:CDS:2 [Gigaspora margarita]
MELVEVKWNFPSLKCINPRCSKKFEYQWDGSVKLCPDCIRNGVRYPSKVMTQNISYWRNQAGLPLECPRCGWIFDDHIAPCIPCLYVYLKIDWEKWTSGSQKIDEFIHKYQVKYPTIFRGCEFIDYSQLKEIQYIGEGGFAKTYKAIWMNGETREWDAENGCWPDSKDRTVALKVFENRPGIENYVYKELYVQSIMRHDYICNVFGVSRDVITGAFIIVMRFAEEGSLRQFNQLNFERISWDVKLYLLVSLATALNIVHKLGFFHCDLHPGNILITTGDISKKLETNLADFGLCIRDTPSENFPNRKLYGMIPFIAPEILNGGIMTKEAEIYSYGMIAYELLTGRIPFIHIQCDEETLISKIILGLRPEFPEDMPSSVTDTINLFLHEDPSMRPTLKDVWQMFSREKLKLLEDIPQFSFSAAVNSEVSQHLNRIEDVAFPTWSDELFALDLNNYV